MTVRHDRLSSLTAEAENVAPCVAGFTTPVLSHTYPHNLQLDVLQTKPRNSSIGKCFIKILKVKYYHADVTMTFYARHDLALVPMERVTVIIIIIIIISRNI